MTCVLYLPFIEWSSNNGISCNPSKCKEIDFKKKGCTQVFPLLSGILQTSVLSILGVTFQEDCLFTTHVRNKLINLTFGLSVYGAVNAERTTVQCLLDQCHKLLF